MSSLRERQKADRRRRILQAAREQFLAQGFEAATIESIAAGAEVSAVTVYNYYGTKGGLLLALVAESDALLEERIASLIEEPPADLVEAVALFAGTIRQHALAFLTKPIWRQVIAASIIEGGSEFGRIYARLDRGLARLMSRMLEDLRVRGAIGAEADLDALGDSLFHLQNARFTQYIALESLADATVDRYLREDVKALLAARP